MKKQDKTNQTDNSRRDFIKTSAKAAAVAPAAALLLNAKVAKAVVSGQEAQQD